MAGRLALTQKKQPCYSLHKKIFLSEDSLNFGGHLNNDGVRPPEPRLELQESDSQIFQFSAEMLFDTLYFFTTSLARAKGIEKNIIAKKCIKKIEYSPDQIKISFWLKQEPTIAPDGKNAPVQLPIVKNRYAPENENSAPFGNREFVKNSL